MMPFGAAAATACGLVRVRNADLRAVARERERMRWLGILAGQQQSIGVCAQKGLGVYDALLLGCEMLSRIPRRTLCWLWRLPKAPLRGLAVRLGCDSVCVRVYGRWLSVCLLRRRICARRAMSGARNKLTPSPSSDRPG